MSKLSPLPLHLRATLLPDGLTPTDLWIVNGRLTFQPQPQSRELAPPNGFVTPGLVDAHTHLHYALPGDERPQGLAMIQQNRRMHLRAGTLLLRDLGTTDEAILNLPHDDGLPVVQAAGLSFLTEPKPPFHVTLAEDLPHAVTMQARKGAQWIKIFVDWPGWSGKNEEPPFGDDPLTYPLEILAQTVLSAHAAGARVAVHAFGRAGAHAAVTARVDSIEHGWGLTPQLLDQMAEQHIAWTPMLSLAAPMLKSAHPEQATWIRSCLQVLPQLLPYAQARGVPILAGTDWFPSIRLHQEVAQLHAFGLTPQEALATATTVARQFLHAPGLEEQAPADLLLFRTDPRLNLSTLAFPELILLRGERVV